MTEELVHLKISPWRFYNPKKRKKKKRIKKNEWSLREMWDSRT